MELTKDVLRAIKENLPSMVAEEMSSFINQAMLDAANLASVKDNYTKLHADYSNLKQKEKEFETASSKLNEAIEISKKADARQAEMELTLVLEKLNQRDFVIAKFEGFLSLLVKNPRAIEIISETQSNVMSSAWDPNDNKYKPFNQSSYRNGNIEKTETK